MKDFDDLGFVSEDEFNSLGFEPEDTDERVSALAALGRGAAQELTLGSSDELGAGVLSGLDLIRRKLGIETEEEKVNKLLKEKGFTGDIGKTMKEKDILSQYKEMRDLSRAEDIKAKKDQAGAYLGGQILGGILPAIVTGGAGAVAQLGKTGLKTAIKAGAKSGAKYGALSGLGESEDITNLPETIGNVLKSTAAGAVTGGILPIGIKSLKDAKNITKDASKNIIEWSEKNLGKTVRQLLQSAKIGAKGQKVTGTNIIETQEKKLEELADATRTLIKDIAKPEAQELVQKSLKVDTRIKVADDLDRYLKDINDDLIKFAPDSDEAKSLKNAAILLQNQKQQILTGGLKDPEILTRTQAVKKLNKKLEEINFQNELGMPEVKTIDDLFNKAAKYGKKGFKADTIDAERIRQNFNLPDTDSAVEMLKDVAKLKIKRPKADPITGEIVDIPQELVQVIKKYQPTEIAEAKGRLYFKHGNKLYSERFTPDQLAPSAEMTPQELYNLQKDLFTLSRKGEPTGVIGKTAKDARKKLEESIPEESKELFKQGMQKYTDIYNLEDLVGSDISSKLGGSEVVKAKQNLSNLLEDFHTLGGTTPSSTRITRKEILNKIKKISPEIGESFEEEVVDSAKKLELARIGDQSSPLRTIGTIESLGVKGGEYLGRTAKGLKDLINLPKDNILKLSSKLQNKNPNLAKVLKNIAETENPRRRSALLFTASQQSDYKKDLEEFFKPE